MKKLGEALTAFIHHQGLEKRIIEADVVRFWEEVMGDIAACKTKPLKFKNGSLHIHVEDDTWRAELQYRVDQIRARLNSMVGKKVVKKIVLI